MYLHIKDKFVRELQNHFDSKLKVEKRVRVVSDLQMFRPKEDKFVWAQQKDKIPEHFMVYFDDEHICTFGADMPVNRVMLQFWRGFREAYGAKKIHLTPPWMREEVKQKTATEKALEKLDKIKPTTKAERMAKDIVTNIVTGESNAQTLASAGRRNKR